MTTQLGSMSLALLKHLDISILKALCIGILRYVFRLFPWLPLCMGFYIRVASAVTHHLWLLEQRLTSASVYSRINVLCS